MLKRTKFFLSVLMLSAFAALPSQAATFTVANTGDNGGANPAPGAGTGTLRQAIIDANAASGADTIAFASGVTGIIQLGGALPTLSDITLNGAGATNLTVRRNTGGSYRIFTITPGTTVTIRNLTLSNGSASGFGGCINNTGTLTLANCILDGNSAGQDGGAISNYHATLNVTACRFSNNSANGSGGGITSDSREDESGNVSGPTSLTVSRSNFVSNTAGNNGGGISNFSGSVHVESSTIGGNTATLLGGGLSTVDGSTDIVNSTLSTNQSEEGGALYSASTTTLDNSTLSGNTATRRGGGISNTNGATTLDSCTISSNTAPSDMGSGIISVGDDGATTTRLGNSIVVNNSDSDVDYNGNQNSFASDDYNLVGTGSGKLAFNSSHDSIFLGLFPLGPLADNGGPTKTRALLANRPNPAINAGSTKLPTDQRGIARPQGTRDDIGAYEFNAFNESLVVTTLADQDDGTSDPTFGFGPATSLREALNFANSNPDSSTITFNLPGSAPKVLNLASALPEITTALTITGPGANLLTIKRNTGGNYRLLTADTSAPLSISGLTLSEGLDDISTLFPGGGALYSSSASLSVNNCVFNGNTGGIGGAIYISEGTATIKNCRFGDNAATDNDSGGGALYNDSGNVLITACTFSGNSAAGSGGAIENDNVMSLTNCTLSDNSSEFDGGAVLNKGGMTLTRCTLNDNFAYEGGAIESETDLAGDTTALNNCTLSGNTAYYYGGGLNNAGGQTTLDSCTITGNASQNNGNGGVYSRSDPDTRTEVRNCIIVGNTVTDVDFGIDTYNSFQSNGHNIIGDGDAIAEFVETGDVTDQSGSQVKLGPLANNGGPTKTHALLAGSPAINAGDTTLPTDQRGIVRPQGARDDVGAFELESLPALSVNNPVSRNEGSAASPGSVTFDIRLTGVNTQTVTVNYQTANGTTNPATAGSDYVEKHGKVTFAPGETLKRVTIFFIGDAVVEPNETFFLDLKTPTKATIDDSRGVGTIRNDDAAPQAFNDEPSQ